MKSDACGQKCLFKQLVDKERNIVLAQLDQLENALKGLQYEGKAFSLRHIKRIDDIVRFLKIKHKEHTKLDEKIVFPYLSKHIPKLLPVLQFLKMEGQSFADVINAFSKILTELKAKNRLIVRHNIIEQLRDKGIYMICLVKSHIQLEKESVYRAIFHELNVQERNSLQKNIEMFWLKGAREGQFKVQNQIRNN